MKLFKEIDLPLDEKDLPLDELDIPLSMQLKASADLDNEFDLSNDDYHNIDNISPQIDSEMKNEQNQDDFEQSDTFGMDERDMPLSDDMGEEKNPEEFDGEEDNPEEFTQEEQQEENPNFQGVIRTVKGACLVYKRQNAENTYDELWCFTTNKDMKKEFAIKKAILAGTDINPMTGDSSSSSPVDNGGVTPQSMDSYSVGNIAFLELNSLPQ